MKVLAAVKYAARLEGEPAFDGPSVAEDALEWGLNEWDEFALEAALQLVEAGEGGEVVAVTVGDERAEEGLLACLAKGADRAVRIWDPALAGADALAIATVLAGFAREEQPDLILTGVQSSDAVNAATGVALAGLLDLPRVAVVKAVKRDGESLIVDRELDGGATEVLRLPLPALLTIQTGANEPRYATLRAIKQARDKPLDALEPAEVGVSVEQATAAAGSRTLALAVPERGEGAAMLNGSPAAIAERIAAIVREEMRR
jgi:electron transfer flavoprotein beta subunit